MIYAIPCCYILSLNIKSPPPPPVHTPPNPTHLHARTDARTHTLSFLCLKQWQLCSKNLLDAFPVNPLSMCLYKHVFERTRRGGKQANQPASERHGLSRGAWLVIITVPWICSPVGKHYLAHGRNEEAFRFPQFIVVAVLSRTCRLPSLIFDCNPFM